ncbi:MAG: DUF4079 domain-containing protein [Cyanobacteria bacterium]|nr:DUF4079 domain-containing protein [Cyanobacteriota bacterium]
MTPLLPPPLAPQPLSVLQWLSLLHPLLMVLFVYPVIGATIRIGIHVRERRLGQYPLPATVGPEHIDHGRWLTTAMVLAVLLALGWSFLHAGATGTGATVTGATGTGAYGTVPGADWPQRPLALALGAAAALASCLALWRVKRPWLRACFALTCWLALLGLGLQPEVPRWSDNPLDWTFWRSHFWGGWLLCGLLLFAMAAAPEIRSKPLLRRLHLAANVLVALLMAVQAITGCRDLLLLNP